ncbi:AAA family ATPase [Bifidobacterium canis]|uniref:ABC transporter ATP-binding protein n=1 Tax=Bifidobacterium canis TaxID=2610880 RepID=A0A7K1J6W3_9BIFI|nr:AAA family ATPase [Bifidobacterium canis]MUH60301.1 ABC transporter ATP-binding protein [Bifidobacterium canis]
MNELIISGLRIDWDLLADSYVSRIPALRSVDELEFSSNVTFFTGENGSGKSTLLEAIALACGFSAEGGSRNFHFSTFDDTSDLIDAITLYRKRSIPQSSFFLRAESFFTMATQAADYDGGRSVLSSMHEMSHGESFMELLLSRTGTGLFLLDEPESALSAQRQLTLLAHMHEMAGAGSQFIVATHSPILLGLPGASILRFDDDGVHPCAYEDTDSYRVTEMFINHRELLLHHLL